jgi:hypothetical protein
MSNSIALQHKPDKITFSDLKDKQLKSFGHETIDFIIHDDELLEFCLSDWKNSGIQILIEKIHFNNSFPENHNFRESRKNPKKMEVFKNGAWVEVPARPTLDALIYKAQRILSNFAFEKEVMRRLKIVLEHSLADLPNL